AETPAAEWVGECHHCAEPYGLSGDPVGTRWVSVGQGRGATVAEVTQFTMDGGGEGSHIVDAFQSLGDSKNGESQVAFGLCQVGYLRGDVVAGYVLQETPT